MYLFDLKKIIKKESLLIVSTSGGRSACWPKVNRGPLQDDCTEPLLIELIAFYTVLHK